MQRKIEAGEPLNPHLSKKHASFRNQDGLLDDWGVHHFHLGIGPHPIFPGLENRSESVVFALVTDEVFYAINTYNHMGWAQTEVVDSLVSIAINAFADDKEDIAKIRSECPKLLRPANDSGYDELIDKMLKKNSISQDYTPLSNDAELVMLLQTLKKPENLDFAQDTVERDFGYFSDMFSIGKNVDETYLNNAYRCHFVEAYVDVGSKANKELKSYFQWLLNRTTEHVNLLAAEKADREDYAKGVHDEEETHKKRLLTPKGNAATIGGFKITANSCVARGKVGTLNPFLEPKTWNGSKFLIVDASFKNVSTSSKYMFPGAVMISKNGKVYKFDKFEMVNESGFGPDTESLNPLITYSTKLIYRIPADLTGRIVWQPDERTADVTISCGSI